jgi:parallel beta-helix repeat protein
MMRHSRSARLVVLSVVFLSLTACTGVRTPPDGSVVTGSTEAESPSAGPGDPQPPGPLPAEDVDVTVSVDDNLKEVVDANPPGTTYLIEAGVHRGAQAEPKDGDTFIGEAGAVLSGATLLSDWQQKGGRWVIGGQTAEGPTHGKVLEGYEPDLHPEDLWVDDTLLRHWATPDVGKGEWHFDYANDQIWLGEDPGTRTVQLAETPWAFSSEAADVTIDNLIIERYASTSQHGAIGGGPRQGNMHRHLRWTVRHTDVRFNHGMGLRMGPGATVEYSWMHHNGELGLGVSGRNIDGEQANDYGEPVTIRYNQFARNGMLGFDPQFQRGGLKIAHATAGSVFEHNWSHDNHGPGVWFDIDNRDAVIRSNLVEDNDEHGIMYEISFGDTLISSNVVRHNGGRGVFLSTSQGVRVANNLIVDNAGDDIQIRGAERGSSDEFGPYRSADITVEDNIVATQSGQVGYKVEGERSELLDPAAVDIRFIANEYRVGHEQPFAWGLASGDDAPRLTFEQWQELGMDRDGALGDYARAQDLPRAAEPFRPTHYGPLRPAAQPSAAAL